MKNPTKVGRFGAASRNRTDTLLLARDFESRMSTSSITAACVGMTAELYYTVLCYRQHKYNMNMINLTSYTLGCRIVFLSEKRSKPYKWYGVASIAGENAILRQDLMQSHELCSGVARRGV